MSVQPPEKVQWRNVVIFSVLAYALAWALWAPGVVPRLGELLTSAATPQDFDDRFKVTTVLVMLTPMIAAIIMRLLVSREGLRHSLGPLRRWRYYALAAITPAVFVTIVLLLDVLSGWGRFTPGTQAPLWTVYLSSLISGVTIGAVLAFGEEYGWRGYLLPKLLPLGEFRASLIVGLIWALWHAPALVAGLNYPGSRPWAAILVFVAVVTAMSFIFTRFFVASGGSVVVVAVLHGSFNSFNDRLLGPQHMAGNPLIVSMGLMAGAVLLLTVVVMYALPRRSRQLQLAE